MNNRSATYATWALMLTLGTVLTPLPSYAQADISVSFDLFSPPPVAVAPPPLPVYDVPPPPEDDLVWIPGSWRWDGQDYFWVPGTWVEPPEERLLWTPGYWGWEQNNFNWHEGYWGPHVGYYGGISYGGGYDGHGFHGGWHDRVFYIDRSVHEHVTYVSFNGGPGGIHASMTAEERSASHEEHIPLTEMQRDHTQAASRNPAFAAAVNHGKPSIAATGRAGDFERDVVAAKQAGARNAAAEHYNAAVRKNPDAEKGGALPRAHEGQVHDAPAPQNHTSQAVRPATQAHPVHTDDEPRVIRPGATDGQNPEHANAVAQQKAAASAKQNEQHATQQPPHPHPAAAQPHEQPQAHEHEQPHSEPRHEEGHPDAHEEHGSEEEHH